MQSIYLALVLQLKPVQFLDFFINKINKLNNLVLNYLITNLYKNCKDF